MISANEEGMENSTDPRVTAHIRAASRTVAIAVLGLGTVVLAGWVLDISALKSIVPQYVTMKVNTALAFLLCGISLWRLQSQEQAGDARGRDTLADVCAALAALVGLLTLIQYVSGWNLGIDEFFINDDSASVGTSSPGRMAPTTAFAFFISGCALLACLRLRYLAIAPILALAVNTISLLALVGYLYRVEPLYGIGPYTRMALHTAVGFFLLSVGIWAARPDSWPAAVIASKYAGGVMARRLSVFVFVIPPFLGWLVIQGARARFYDVEMELPFLALLSTLTLGFLTLSTSKSLSERDMHAQQEEGKLRRSLEERITAEQAARSDAQRAQAETQQLQEQIIRSQQVMLEQLSTPIIPISNHAIVMPLIGTVDARRVERIMDALLRGVETRQADLVIIDVTGVPIVDTQVASGLVQAARAVRLLGAQVVLTGMRPDVAQTLVELGADLSGITTLGSLQHGIEYAKRRR